MNNKLYTSYYFMSSFNRLRPKSAPLEAISKPQIAFEGKAGADDKAQHTREYVSILKRPSTQQTIPCDTPAIEESCNKKVGLYGFVPFLWQGLML